MGKEFCLGIDVGKYHHQASLINEHQTMVGESLKFNNDQIGFEKLRQTIIAQLPPQTAVKIGMEATGHYYWHLKKYLLEHGFNHLEIINPIETQRVAKTRIRKIKNDKVDSLAIAKIISSREISPCAQDDQELKQLRELTRFCEKLKGQSRFYKQEIITLIERLCPEFSANFSNIFLATPLMVIEKYFIENVEKDELARLITKTSRGRIKEDKAKHIIDILNNSLGSYYQSENAAFQLKLILQSLKMIKDQIKQIQDQIKKQSQNFKQEIAFVESIKGVSNYMASAILSELGDVNRFKNKGQIVAFAGLDPSVKESGQYKRKQGNHISKRGSKYLRKQLYYAAKTSILFDPELKAFYQKKKAQGKHYNVIMVAIARKILLRVQAVLKQKRPYELRSS